jgi:hypothetical protein
MNTEAIHQKIEVATVEDLINVLNDYTKDEGSDTKIVPMTDNKFIADLSKRYGPSINNKFNNLPTNKYILWDDENKEFHSFSTKEELVNEISYLSIFGIYMYYNKVA